MHAHLMHDASNNNTQQQKKKKKRKQHIGAATYLWCLGLIATTTTTAAGYDAVAICNTHGNSPYIKPNPMYVNFIKDLYGHELSVTSLTLSADCPMYEAINNGIHIDVNGNVQACTDVRNNQKNAEKGVDLVVKWPSDLPKTYLPPQTPPVPTYSLTLKYVNSFAHSFVAKTAKSTVWTSVYLDKDSIANAIHPLYSLPAELFQNPVSFSSKGFAGLEDFFVFNAPALKRLTTVQQGVWGIVTAGCRPPIFKVAVNWKPGSPCAHMDVRVTQITEAESFKCTMQYVTGDPKLSIGSLMLMAYAVDPLQGRISNSWTHSAIVMNCLFPTGPQMQFSYWGQWTPDTPGTCVPCVPRSLAPTGSTPVARKCDRSKGETDECCFTCRPGYNSLDYVDAALMKHQHCVAMCPAGKYYENPNAYMPNCIACPAGKFSQPDSMACQTCSALGFPNSYASARGCVFCGFRALATGGTPDCLHCDTTCTGCQPQMYAPPNATQCQPCPTGWVLRTSQSSTCSPCAPGFYALDGRCLQCPTNTFKPAEGKGECLPCGSGFQSVPNRTLCVPCTELSNRTLTPFAIYRPDLSGCSAMCNRSVSFAQGTNPYVPEGCVSCSQLVVPTGMYASREDCARFLHCTNVPSPNSTALLQYTGSGSYAQNGTCPWKCKPGWTLKGSTCYACPTASFNATLHVYTDGCAFECIPGLFYRGVDATSCTQRCVQLEDVLFPRCSDYYFFARQNGSRIQRRSLTPHLLGYCGSNATDPTSELGVVRHVGRYGFPSVVGKCGDAILSSIYEECDDGNTRAGDGCSATCKVERTGYWDCDVLGEPCLPNCGWQDLQGYALPSPIGTLPWCTGIAYYSDFLLKVPLAARALWMQTNLISCRCAHNPHQTLPYSECNYTNRGCRQCLPGYYQDDLYARCSKCGSACALGFWPFNLTRGDGTNVAVKAKYWLSTLDLCGPGISTSQNLSFADPVLEPLAFGVDQIMIGCAPCTAGAYNSPSQVVFTTADCQWNCKRDYGNIAEPKYYCKGPVSPYCNQQCLDCASSLSLLRPPTLTGWYIQSCADGIGHAYARCTNLTDPNAIFTDNSALVGDSGGCPWACKAGYQLSRGLCVPCKRQITCADGEIPQPCAAAATGSYCAPCSLVMPPDGLQPLQVWHSSSAGQCVPGCEPGFSYQNSPNESCRACSTALQMQCDLDQLLVPCNLTSDAYCTACPPDSLLPNFEYYASGTCKARCVQGFAFVVSSSLSTACASCAQSVQCGNGQRRTHDCLLPEQRGQLPTCVPCDPIDTPLNRPSPGRVWAAGCTTSCYGGWMFESQENRTCVPCNASAGCLVGQQGLCSQGQLLCTPCSTLLDVSRQFQQAGDCTVVCAPGFEGPDCLPSDNNSNNYLDDQGLNASATSSNRKSASEVMGVSLLLQQQQQQNSTATTTSNTDSFFPTRTLPHS